MMRLKALHWKLVKAMSTLNQTKLENANLVSRFLNVFLDCPTLKQQHVYFFFLCFQSDGNS